MKGNSSRPFQKFFQEKFLNRWYLILPAIFLFSYIIIRAKVISLTWDESYTFFEFVRPSNWLPQHYEAMSANNHLLNTWLMKISVFLFGESELALRLPNIIAGGIFLFILIRLLTRIFSDWKLRLIGFILMACNPYVIDYFSIARGYGISIALLMCGIYFICKFISTNFQLRESLSALLFFALATLTNLTCIPLFLSAAFLLAFTVYFFGNKKDKIKKIILFLSLPIIFLLILTPFIFNLQQAGAFYLGREATSPLVIFASLGDAMAYGKNYAAWLSPLLVKLFYLIPVIALIETFRRRKIIRSSASTLSLFFFTALFFLSFIIPVMLHYVMGINFISGRTALFFLPILFLLFLFVIQRSERMFQYLVLLFTVFSLTHFCLTINTNSFYDFREQADVKNAMQLLRTIPDQQCEKNTISSTLPFGEQVSYYLLRFGMNNFTDIPAKEEIQDCEYYYFTAQQMKTQFKDAEIIQEFPKTQTVLFRLRRVNK
jgi:hypothetical protein